MKTNQLILTMISLFILMITSCEKSGDNNGNGTEEKKIVLITPNGGETWYTDSTYNIEWSYEGNISEVDIKLYKNGVLDNLDITVLVGNSGSGTYSWTIAEDQEEGEDYQIRICDNSDNSIYDNSDNNFTIQSESGGNGDPIDGSTWGLVNNSCSWGPRSYFTALVYDGKIWALPGYKDYDVYVNDVWYSIDGSNWTQATSNAPFAPRDQYSAVVFKNKMWVLGGAGDQPGDDFYNDVWSSTDGVTWTQETNSAGWSARYGHASVVFNNKIWVISDDSWSSTDGINWVQESSSSGSSTYKYHSCVVFDNKIYKICGYDDKKDVWYSSDGKVWVQATADPGWPGREGHVSIVADNKIWTIGCSNKDDVWYSENGSTWIQATADAGWGAREFFGAVLFNGKIWILGGYSAGMFYSDIWSTL